MKLRNKDKGHAGFTLLELLVATAIMAIMTSVAIPLFARYSRSAMTCEATTAVKHIFNGARAYWMDNPNLGVNPIPRQVPAPGATPTPALGSCCAAGGTCAPQPTNWDTEVWTALSFSMSENHRYSYSYTAFDEFEGGSFVAIAHGDLDCNGTYSTFEMYGMMDSERGSGVSSLGGIRRIKHLE